MSNNTKIYSEAIAEAKSIRETAMANAKLALEEAFAPRMQEMMSNKLEALAEEMEEEEVNENTEGDSMDEISLEELIAELDSLEEAADKDADEAVNENTLEEAEDEDAVGEITVDELKDIIRSVMNDVMETGEEGEEEEGEEEAGEEEEASEEDELNLDEILAELDSLNEGEDLEELEEGIMDSVKDLAAKAGMSVDKFIDSVGQKLHGGKGLGTGPKMFEESEDEMEEGIGSAIKGAAQKVGKGLEKAYDAVANAKPLPGSERFEKGIDRGTAALKKAGVLGTGMTKGYKAFESAELEEALNTIAVLRSSLNEVNLLNAKLLYVNKLFKGRNLTEAQKVKVINAFDRAETVKETKNIFETLKESFTTTKNPIKESLSFASKAAGVAPNRQPIVEGDEFMKRMQKIAGII
jgi:hypothetical protein